LPPPAALVALGAPPLADPLDTMVWFYRALVVLADAILRAPLEHVGTERARRREVRELGKLIGDLTRFVRLRRAEQRVMTNADNVRARRKSPRAARLWLSPREDRDAAIDAALNSLLEDVTR
jgi:hypothetical protein